MDRRRKAALAYAAGFMVLTASGAVHSAGGLDPSLAGAWTASATDCAKLFVRQGGALAYRKPVDKFAQAAIIGPQEIRLPSSSCRVENTSRANGAITIKADCQDSISYTQQTVQIKVKSSSEIVYSPTGDPALDTTLVKCPL